MARGPPAPSARPCFLPRLRQRALQHQRGVGYALRADVAQELADCWLAAHLQNKVGIRMGGEETGAPRAEKAQKRVTAGKRHVPLFSRASKPHPQSKRRERGAGYMLSAFAKVKYDDAPGGPGQMRRRQVTPQTHFQ